jgi:hypothetical protein
LLDLLSFASSFTTLTLLSEFVKVLMGSFWLNHRARASKTFQEHYAVAMG